MLVYRYDKNTKKYIKSEPAMLDPLETKAAGHNIYLLPANCTFKEPPQAREGYDIVFNTNIGEWQQEKQQKAEEQPAPVPEPTQEEKRAAELAAMDARYAAEKAELLNYYLEAMAIGDKEMAGEITAELKTLNENYDTERAALSNG